MKCHMSPGIETKLFFGHMLHNQHSSIEGKNNRTRDRAIAMRARAIGTRKHIYITNKRLPGTDGQSDHEPPRQGLCQRAEEFLDSLLRPPLVQH